MDRINIDINRYVKTKTKVTSERSDIIRQFVEGINAERKGTKWKQVSPRFVAIKLSHLSKFDLYYFLKVCQNADEFGRAFFGLLKTGNAIKNPVNASSTSQQERPVCASMSPHGTTSDTKRT